MAPPAPWIAANLCMLASPGQAWPEQLSTSSGAKIGASNPLLRSCLGAGDLGADPAQDWRSRGREFVLGPLELATASFILAGVVISYAQLEIAGLQAGARIGLEAVDVGGGPQRVVAGGRVMRPVGRRALGLVIAFAASAPARMFRRARADR